MPDTMTKQSRSKLMSKIQGGLNKNSLERTVHNWLKGNHVRHAMYPKMIGNPDIWIGDDGGFAVFIDGCFWHMCPQHYRRPKSNVRYWIEHVEHDNVRRQRKRRNLPYSWIHLWEHEVRRGTFKSRLFSVIKLNKSLLRARRRD